MTAALQPLGNQPLRVVQYNTNHSLNQYIYEYIYSTEYNIESKSSKTLLPLLSDTSR